MSAESKPNNRTYMNNVRYETSDISETE